MSKTSKTALLSNLRRLLSEAFAMHRRGAAQTRLGRSYGYADGYMRVLLDAGIVTEAELLRIVTEVRTGKSSPAQRPVAA